MNTTQTKEDVFLQDVLAGLSANQKFLNSKYFYDERGDEFFRQIMNMSEYYLTDCEMEIIKERAADIFNALPFKNQPFHIIELGAGDGEKTKHLLKVFYSNNEQLVYQPIDISGNILAVLEQNVAKTTNIPVKPVNDLYLTGLETALNRAGELPCLILFLGSNIGNLRYEAAKTFLSKISEIKKPADHLLLGLDLKKKPETILAAYNDAAGITKNFNLNLLERINNEFNADFDLANFRHYPVYDPHTGEARSYLISEKEQTVTLEKAGKSFHFREFETIFVEISKKYALEEAKSLLTESGWSTSAAFTDQRSYFSDILSK